MRQERASLPVNRTVKFNGGYFADFFLKIFGIDELIKASSGCSTQVYSMQNLSVLSRPVSLRCLLLDT